MENKKVGYEVVEGPLENRVKDAVVWEYREPALKYLPNSRGPLMVNKFEQKLCFTILVQHPLRTCPVHDSNGNSLFQTPR